MNPEILSVYLTNRCNLRCAHCYEAFKSTTEISLFELKNSIEKLCKEHYKNGIKRINLLGGEPTIHSEFCGVVDYLSTICSDIQVSTNGFFVNNIPDSVLEKISFIQISVESLNERIADRYRGKGYCKHTLEVISYLNDKNRPVGIKMLLTKDTVEVLHESMLKVLELGISSVAFNRFVPEGRGERLKDMLLSSTETELVYKYLLMMMMKYGLSIHMSDGIWDCNYQKTINKYIPEAGCSVTKGDLALMYNGDLMLCRRLNLVIGNINDPLKKYNEFWNSDLFKKLETREFDGKCGSCDKKEYCGGCRAYVYQTTGNLLGSDNSCFLS